MNEAEYLMKNYGDRGGCYWPRRITPSEISIILHMIRKPNSIIFLLFIQNNSSFKNMANTCFNTSIDPSMLSSSTIVPFRVVQLRKYSPNSRCRPSSHLLAVLAMFSVIFSASSYSWNELNVSHFPSSEPKQLNLVPRSPRLTVH